MATSKKSPASTALAKKVDVKAIDQQLALRAQELGRQLAQGGGARVQLDNKNGVFMTGEGETLGASIQVIIVDFVSANHYYIGVYNPNNLQPPVCAAIGRNIDEMAPFGDSPDVQSDLCVTCPQNQYGSAPNGNGGKACKNTRALALLLVNEDGTVDEKLYTFSVPPTGIKSFDGTAKFIARTYNSLPLRCIVTMNVEDRGTYSSVSFSDPTPNPSYTEHAALMEAAAELITRKPDFTPRDAAKPAAETAKRSPASRVAQRR